MSERERPRGSSVWVGLDPFGDEVVSRLSQWFADDPTGHALKDANQILAGVRIGSPTPDASDAPDPTESTTLDVYDIAPAPGHASAKAIACIETAIATLLAAQQSREALAWADREILTPHVWIVADLCSPETAGLASWLQQLHDRLDELNVEARLFLLLRHLSWGLVREQQLDAASRTYALIDQLVGETTPGRVSIMAYVLTDRDSVGGYYDEGKRETISLAFRVTELLLLTDAAHGNAPGTEHAFVAPLNGAPGPWETLPIFGSAAATCLRWDTPAIAREIAERRRAHLFTVLSAGVPPTFDPQYPVLGSIRMAEDGRWPQLEVPRWSPRFWQSARQEFYRYRDLLETWMPAATTWRHEMLVIHRDRCRSVDRYASTTLVAYEEALADQERIILTDDSLRGLFAPLHRLYDRATADLQVQLQELRHVPATPPPPLDAVVAIPTPRETLAGADDKLTRALERKINPLLLVQVTILTIVALWGLISFTLISARERLTSVPGQDAIFRNVPQLATILQDLPDDGQILLWTGIVVSASVGFLSIFTALKQRVRLERAWEIPYQRSIGWRDDTASSLPRDIRGVEQALAKSNLQRAEAMVNERRQRLSDFEKHGLTPLAARSVQDEAVTRDLPHTSASAQPLSDLQVSQIIAAFKQRCAHIPSSQWKPEYLLAELFAEAADQAGDPPLDLRSALVPIRRQVLRSMPPDGAVRVQQLASTAPAERNAPALVRLLAVPADVVGDLRFDPALAVVLPLPIDTRFYSAILQTGMSARRILSRSTPWESDPLNPEADPSAAPSPSADSERPEPSDTSESGDEERPLNPDGPTTVTD